MFENILDQVWNAPNWAVCGISDSVHDLTGFRCQFGNGATQRMATGQRVGRSVPRQVVTVPGRRADTSQRAPTQRYAGGFGANFIARG